MTRLADLLAAERAALAAALGDTAFTIAAPGEDHCRVDTDGLAVHFYRRAADGLIHSSLALAAVPAHPVPLSDHLHTWLLLKSRGEDWPETTAPDPLAAELARLARALPVVRDATMLVESLLWEAGYMDGYARWD